MDKIIYPEMRRQINKDNIVIRIKADDWLYVLDDMNTVRMFLVIGNEKALLIDAGFGFVDFRPLIKEVTDLPVTVVCTHGHDDHILGCRFFDEAYLGEEDLPLCTSNDNPAQKEKQIAAMRKKTPDVDTIVDKENYLYNTTLKNCNFKFAKDGDIFDLGGITLEVIPIPGHTLGSIALYCKEKKAIFVGDTMGKNHMLHYGQALEISAEPQYFIRGLSRISKLDVETVWPAHGDLPAGPELITDTRDMFVSWTKNYDIARDMKITPLDSVFGTPGGAGYQYEYPEKNMKMSYHLGHLEQILKYMKTHDGAIE
ncbi:MAG: MBL fold metallo-hydrolase [Lachnospiraceae bacterium]|jgi:glyoxylase-like metal-dependent hydrolase (beta-lactamase superfamily II)|nr:MBL fold metallo-hydrolase [Lachnospiraceae bacterium]